MLIVMGVIGFIAGFCTGQFLLAFMLRHKSNEDLKQDKSLRVYGVLNWAVAILGAFALVEIYRKYFG